MKSILFITNSLGFGGAEKMLTFVARQLATRGYKVSIINLNKVPNYLSLQKQEINEDVQVFDIKASKSTEYIKNIIRVAKQVQAEVLIGFTAFPNMYAKIAGTILGIPSIMSERGDPTRTMSYTLKGKISRFIINRSKGGVFQTDGAMKFYGKGLQKRGKVIPNPIFVKGEVPVVNFEEREKTVVSVGRFDNRQKRYDVMIKAFKLFNDRHPEYILKLYGEGDDRDAIKDWCSELGILEKVKFMGLTKNAMQVISKDGMFVITSDYEGISNALLEAMAVGLPCVSTDHTPGGARYLITHGVNGLLAPIGEPEKIAEYMCKFAEDKELAKSCGEKAKEVLVKFAPEKIIDSWEEYILSVDKNR